MAEKPIICACHPDVLWCTPLSHRLARWLLTYTRHITLCSRLLCAALRGTICCWVYFQQDVSSTVVSLLEIKVGIPINVGMQRYSRLTRWSCPTSTLSRTLSSVSPKTTRHPRGLLACLTETKTTFSFLPF